VFSLSNFTAVKVPRLLGKESLGWKKEPFDCGSVGHFLAAYQASVLSTHIFYPFDAATGAWVTHLESLGNSVRAEYRFCNQPDRCSVFLCAQKCAASLIKDFVSPPARSLEFAQYSGLYYFEIKIREA